MCGDGTNDVGALKQAHVGIALVNDVKLEKVKKTTTNTPGATPGSPVTLEDGKVKEKGEKDDDDEESDSEEEEEEEKPPKGPTKKLPKNISAKSPPKGTKNKINAGRKKTVSTLGTSY